MIELQRKLLGDSVRNDAFHAALKKVIKKGETTVADIGSGTGFLSFLASKIGAKHCWLYEYGDILLTSKALAKRNKIKNCTFVHAHSAEILSAPKVDVLVSETLGNYALEENIIESVEDAKRFLKPTGIIIPAKVSQFACPVISDRLMKDIDVFDQKKYGLDFTEARTIGLNNMYVKHIEPKDLLKGSDAIREWDIINFSKKNASVRKATIEWKVNSPVTIFGIALWWNAELAEGISLSTSPLSSSTHWDQIFLPFLNPIKLAAGHTLSLSLVSDTRPQIKINLTWEAVHLDARGKKLSVQKLDMRKGHIN